MRKGVQRLYREVAPTYEAVNHVLTFGLDIRWRKKAARELSGKAGEFWLDVCCGTGEMTQNLSLQAESTTRILSVDFSPEMISLARKKDYAKPILFILTDVGSLPFADATFDCLVISFSTRNINLNRREILRHLREFFRVLKPGGCFLNLETSQPSSPLLKKCFHFYIKTIVPALGSLISGARSGYRYLAYTVPRFYSSEDFTALLNQVGFREVRCQKLLFGLAAIHLAAKQH